jgi:hypothetical protein
MKGTNVVAHLGTPAADILNGERLAMNRIPGGKAMGARVCFGKPCIRGTRTRISLLHAAGASREWCVALPGRSAA